MLAALLPMIGAVLKVVGIITGLKNVIEGVKSGDIGQAIMGGVTAFTAIGASIPGSTPTLAGEAGTSVMDAAAGTGEFSLEAMTAPDFNMTANVTGGLSGVADTSGLAGLNEVVGAAPEAVAPVQMTQADPNILDQVVSGAKEMGGSVLDMLGVSAPTGAAPTSAPTASGVGATEAPSFSFGDIFDNKTIGSALKFAGAMKQSNIQQDYYDREAAIAEQQRKNQNYIPTYKGYLGR